MANPEAEPSTAFSVYLTTTQLQHLGALTVFWAQLEAIVEWMIYRLRGQTFMQGRTTALPRDISKRIGLLAALAGDHLEPAKRREVLALCDRAQVAAPKRNIASHSVWSSNAFARPQEVRAASWFNVPVGDPLPTLLASEIEPLMREAGAISLSLYRLLESIPEPSP